MATKAPPKQRRRDNHAKHAQGKAAAETFVNHLVKTPNKKGIITAAARAAYPNQSARSARVTGSKLLADPNIRAIFEERRQRAAEHADLSRQELIGLLAQMAYASLGDVQNNRGELDWDVAQAKGLDHLVGQVEVTERHSEQRNKKTGKVRITHRRITTRYKMPDKVKAADLLAELLGWKKQPMKNPVDSARESYAILRLRPEYRDIPDRELAQLAQESHGLPAAMIPDIMAGVVKR